MTREFNSTPVDSIVDVDIDTSNRLTSEGIAILFDDAVERKEIKDAVLQETKTVHIIKGKTNMQEYMVGKAFQSIYQGKAVTGMSEGTAADGGNLIGTAVGEVMGMALETSKVWSKCRKVVLPDRTNSVKIPVDKNAIFDMAGKPIGYNPAEGAQKTATKLEFGVQTLTLGKTVFYIPVTEELLADASMLDGWIRQSAFGKLATTLDNSVLSGAASYSGVIGNATYTASLAISAVPTIEQIYEAQSHIYPSMNPEWYMGPQDWFAMKAAFADSNNLNNQLINPNGFVLAGMKVNVIPLLSQVVLADFSQYTVAVPRVNDQLAVSEHIRFDYDEVVYRLVHRSAGAPCFSPRTGADGITLGAFVQSAE